jgi:hypothetical protein
MNTPKKNTIQSEEIKKQNDALQECWELRKLVYEKKKNSKIIPKKFG